MNYRKLRIAWSLGWGVICLLLIALWVRSLSYSDFLYGSTTNGSGFVSIVSSYGSLSLIQSPNPPSLRELEWEVDRIPILDPMTMAWRPAYYSDQRSAELLIPFWMIGAVLIAMGVGPWFGRRFSLRTLLIAATVVAVGLGLLVMMLRGS
jgi:hypothetical protein